MLSSGLPQVSSASEVAASGMVRRGACHCLSGPALNTKHPASHLIASGPHHKCILLSLSTTPGERRPAQAASYHSMHHDLVFFLRVNRLTCWYSSSSSSNESSPARRLLIIYLHFLLTFLHSYSYLWFTPIKRHRDQIVVNRQHQALTWMLSRTNSIKSAISRCTVQFVS